MKKTRSLLILLVIGVLMVFVTTGYAKDSYPTRPIELLVGYAAGGASDIAARLVAPYMEKELGQPVVVVNKPGAGGEIAYTALAKAAGDGYTLAFINAPATISIPLSHKVNYTMKDYAFIGNVIYHENLIVVKEGGAFSSIEQLLAKAKQNPGVISVGNSGPYADDHLASLAFQNAVGLKLKDIAFKGTAPSLVALLGGHIDTVVCNVADIVEHVQQGQVRVLATMGAERNPLFPDAPTLKEMGYPVLMGNYTTLAAPSKISPERLQKLCDALAKAMSNPDFIKRVEEAKLPAKYFNSEEIAKIYQESEVSLQNLWQTLGLPSQ
jgi:tripartite-type tricarboxylate transporter receptor subunit TctC